MKTLVIACGSGIATSTVVAHKIAEFLDGEGFAGAYRTLQCSITEAATTCKQASADLLITTTGAASSDAGAVAGEGLCPCVSGLPFLTGLACDPLKQQLLEIMRHGG